MAEDLLPSPGAERAPPPIGRLFDPSFFIPFFAYLAIFRLSSILVASFAWQKYTGFKQYRLHNLSVCLLHSFISGSWALLFMLWNPNAMFNDTIYWYEPWAAHLPILSIAYFVNDTVDMARHEISRWTAELFLHHAASIFVFLCAVLPQRFIPYAYWALLMEVNSVFLHIRSMMQISEKNNDHPRMFGIIKQLNIVTFVIFRFAVQAWQIQWAWHHVGAFHWCYALVALVGGVFFLVINCILFYRIIVSDGLLGERLKETAAIGRDNQTFVKLPPSEKKSN